MPDYQINVSDEEKRILEAVRIRQGLDSIEEAAEWLVRQCLLRQTRNLSGRGRALYLVTRNKK